MNNEDENGPLEIDKIIHEPARLQIMTHLYVVEEADFLFMESTYGNRNHKKPHTILRLTPLGRTAFEKYRAAIERVFEDIPD